MKAESAKCGECSDSGLRFTKDSKGFDRMYRCSCEAGMKLKTSLFAASDKDKTKPIEIPELPTRKSGRELQVGDDS